MKLLCRHVLKCTLSRGTFIRGEQACIWYWYYKTKSWLKPCPCCMLLRKLLFFTFYFQFNLLADIPTGIVLALIYTLSANRRALSSQKWHAKSHFLGNIIALMTMYSIMKVAQVILLFINHYSSSSVCTAVTSSTFSHLQGPYRCNCRKMKIALSLNHGADYYHGQMSPLSFWLKLVLITETFPFLFSANWYSWNIPRETYWVLSC